MKTVEYWRWRYRDPQLGCIRQTTVALTEEEGASYPEAERIEGSLTVREVNGLYMDQGGTRILIFQKGPYLIFLSGPSGSPIDRLIALGNQIQV